MTSGGVLSQYDQVTDNQLSMEEVRAIVNEAARARRVVAAHAHSHGGIQTAIDAGGCEVDRLDTPMARRHVSRRVFGNWRKVKTYLND
jgi:imidazolonepropionase-like amidohydrolase